MSIVSKKKSSHFLCQQCEAVTVQWAGRCEQCGSWNSIVEDSRDTSKLHIARAKNSPTIINALDANEAPTLRLLSGLSEFDAVCGGGIVPGSALIIGGEPGVGKSTLLLHVANHVSLSQTVLYVSGEESYSQIRDRCQRLQISPGHLAFMSSTSLEEVLDYMRDQPQIKLVIIDSIQTMASDAIAGIAGSISQVRACAFELIQYTKARYCTLILIGHVTKEGAIAGPKTLEHMVDTVLYFDKDPNYEHILLRTVKNRFGPTHEVGIFTMSTTGIESVVNPSKFFLREQHGDGIGTAIFPYIEGSRPLLIEIQALVCRTTFAAPRRTTIGWDTNRLAMLLAILENRCRAKFSDRDIYLNIIGGLKVADPGIDLAVALALMSSLHQKPLKTDMVCFGEIGLGGELRSVRHADLRVREAERLGFKQVICKQRGGLDPQQGISIYAMSNVAQLESVLNIHDSGDADATL